MKFLKENKYTIILILVFILIIMLGYGAYKALSPDEKKAEYGTRLDENKDHPIDSELFKTITEEIEKDKNVEKVSIRLQGKIIKNEITVVENMSIANAKKVADTILTKYSDDIKSYYSIEFYLLKTNEEQNNFPILGMKDPLSKTISWSKDREITKSE